MYFCLDCGQEFFEPRVYEERHGFDEPPYEQISCCPICGGDYVEAQYCDHCGNILADEYVHVIPLDKKYCSDCFHIETT